MGYDTRYTLRVDTAGNEATSVMVHQALLECDDASFALTLDERAKDYYESKHPAKWYDYDRDLRRISKEFTGVVFTLNGMGDDRKDIWQAFYCDGRGYREEALITFPAFSYGKLK